MSKHFLSRVLAVCGVGRREQEAPVMTEVEPAPEFELPIDTSGEPKDSLVGRCYRKDGELYTVLKDGTNALVRSDKNAVPWYEPRAVVLQNLARHGLEKPACSSSGFWYDAGKVPKEEHIAVQLKKPPGSVRHWMDL